MSIGVAAPSTPLGDLNCDGAVDPADIAPFALALSDPVAYGSAYPACALARADVNGDGLEDGRDVTPFVAALLAP